MLDQGLGSRLSVSTEISTREFDLKQNKKKPQTVHFTLFLDVHWRSVGLGLLLAAGAAAFLLHEPRWHPELCPSCLCWEGSRSPSRLAQQGRGVSFLPGCPCPSAAPHGSPAPAVPQQGWSPTAWHGRGPPEMGPS